MRAIPTVLASLGAAFLAAQPAAAKDDDMAVILEPSSDWHLDYADDKCTLARQFGSEADAHILQFTQTLPSESFGLSVGGNSFRRFKAWRDISHSFGQVSTKSHKPYFGSFGEFGRGLVYSSTWLEDRELVEVRKSDRSADDEQLAAQAPSELSAIDLDLAAKVKSISIMQGNREVRYETGEMAAPFAALNHCTADLFASWGVDIDKHRKYRRGVKWTNEAEIARKMQRDYPQAALRRGESGIFDMRVIVDERGELVDCHLEGMTKTEALNSDVCKLMKEADFEPALDIDGKPMKSYYSSRITYRIR